MQDPAHPGPIVRHDVLEPLGLSVSTAAQVLGVARPTLSNLLDGRAALTPEMAIRIETAFGAEADHLLRVQLTFDLAEARRRQDQIAVERYEPA